VKKLVLTFPDAATRGRFVAWFLDAGGDQNLNDFIEHDGGRALSSDSPGGGDWDWQRLGDDAEEHVIEFSEIDDG
jgi:hypothetical protein